VAKERVAIVTDSTSDLSRSERERLGIAMVPLNVHFGAESLRDQEEITARAFMQRLVSSSVIPTTSQPSPAQFRAAYEAAAKHHDSVVAVVLSSKLSGTYQSATLAAAEVAGSLHVEVVDSLNASLGLGFQVIRAVELAQSGLPATEIATKLRSETALYHLVFFVDTLEYLQRGGRIGKAASIVGGVLQLKPLLRIDEGQVVPYERTRTRGRAVLGLRDFVQGFPAIARLGVLYSSDAAEAEELARALSGSVPGHEITMAEFGPVLAAHVGPRAMGVCLYEGANR
jgi:DegV family protein with EDD domain